MRNTFALLALIILAVIAQWAADRLAWRIDLTEQQLFTLNQASHDLVAELAAPLELRLYLSDDLPARMQPVADFVRDMLTAYQQAGAGQVTLTMIDPGNDPQLVELAHQLGIFRTKASVTAANKVEVVDVWFGLAVFHRGNHEIFPAMGDIENVEYDISSAIARLTQAETPQLVLLGPNYLEERLGFVFDTRYDLKGLTRELSTHFNVRHAVVQPEGPAPDLTDADLVIAWGLPRYRDDQLYVLDQYLMRGKPLLLMAPGTYINAAMLTAAPVPPNRADDFYAHLGFAVDRSLVGDTQASKIRYTDSTPPVLKEYALYPRLVPGLPGLNPKHTATAYLQSLVVPWASPLQTIPREDVRAEIIATSSAQAWLVKEPLVIDPQQVPGPTEFDTYALGLSLHGSFTSFFDTPPTDFDTDAHRQTSAAATHVLVWGSEHMLTQTQDRSLVAWAQHTAGFLSHRALMAGIDRRDNTFRPIRQVSKQMQARLRVLSVAIMPLLVVVLFLLRGALRRRAHRRFLKSMQARSS